jgi:hypothetical protein
MHELDPPLQEIDSLSAARELFSVVLDRQKSPIFL